MKRVVAAIVLVGSLALVPGCGVSYAGVAAGVVALQAAVIADAGTGQLPASDEGIFLEYLGQIEMLLLTAPSGMVATIQSTWASALKDIPAADQTKYSLLIATVSTAVNGL